MQSFCVWHQKKHSSAFVFTRSSASFTYIEIVRDIFMWSLYYKQNYILYHIPAAAHVLLIWYIFTVQVYGESSNWGSRDRV